MCKYVPVHIIKKGKESVIEEKLSLIGERKKKRKKLYSKECECVNIVTVVS